VLTESLFGVLGPVRCWAAVAQLPESGVAESPIDYANLRWSAWWQ